MVPFILFCFAVPCALAQTGTDMRLNHQVLEKERQQLVEKAIREKQSAQNTAAARQKEIFNDKTALQKAISNLKHEINTFQTENKILKDQTHALKTKHASLLKDLEESRDILRELSGFALGHARDLKALMRKSPQSGLAPDRHKLPDPVLLGQRPVSMADIQTFFDLIFEEIHASGQVRVTNGSLVDRQGKEQEAQLLILGNFTGIYTLGDETGFLLYSEESQRFFALSRLPSARITAGITDYLDGRSDSVVMDISKGAAIRQLTHELSLVEQLPKGGAIVWPILAILVLAVLILCERIVFFVRRRTNTDQLMNKLRELILAGDWDGCKTYLETRRKRLVPKILLTALALKDRTRNEMENALQEAILGEIPAVERFLSTLGMLAAIAPLLGLLGTVTGMINTFHTITYYGTSDPRMMSGGISEALVTTMLGLCVAIPIMLAHTLLSRRVETQISRMEEKSVAFVNLVFKTSALKD